MTNNKQLERYHFPEPVNVFSNIPSRFEPHWHHYTEILFYPLDSSPSGENPVINIEQVRYEIKPGDVLVIWSSEMHSVISNTSHSLAGLQFESTMLTDLPEFASISHFLRNYHLIDASDPQMASLAKYMHSKMQDILELNVQKKQFYTVETVICLMQIFIQFGQYLKKNLLPSDLMSRQGNAKTMDKINQACYYIAENCDKDLTLDSVAEMVGFSSCYFSRVFKQTVKRNFVEYLTLQRLKKAQNLLTEFDTPITSVAMESGFKSISTFNRVFQKYKGCSPSEFKRHYLQQ